MLNDRKLVAYLGLINEPILKEIIYSGAETFLSRYWMNISLSREENVESWTRLIASVIKIFV
jgi:hypothetical protein